MKQAVMPQTILSLIVCSLLAFITPAEAESVFTDFATATIKENQVVGPSGQVWDLWQKNSAGTFATVAGRGLVMRGVPHTKMRAAFRTQALLNKSNHGLKVRFTLAKPAIFNEDLVCIYLRTAPGDISTASGYKIAYGLGSYSRTDWSISNTTDPKSVKGGTKRQPYRLVYGRRYTAYIQIENKDIGVEIKLYLDDPEVKGDLSKPLLTYLDASPQKISENGAHSLQLGTETMIYPGAEVTFRDVTILSATDFQTVLAKDHDGHNYPTDEVLYSERQINRKQETWRPHGFHLPNLFKSDMIFQRDMPVNIWGFADRKEKIAVSINGKSASATAGADGTWQVSLPPMPAGGPYELTVKGKTKSKVLKNVMIGEVWLVAGQSNMAWWLAGSTGGLDEAAQADYSNIRYFAGWGGCADHELFEVPGGKWSVMSPKLQGKFSAIGYYLAKDLHADLGVPIGLINTSRAGTELHTWVPESEAESLLENVFRKYNGKQGGPRMDPGLAYNTMVAPWRGFNFRGFVWYQGEGNAQTWEGKRYADELIAMLKAYRRDLSGRDFPVIIIQIAGKGRENPKVPWAYSSWVRQSMEQVAETLPHAGLVVTTDVSEIDNIHPANKAPVGKRVYYLAKNLAYGGANIRSPLIDKVSRDGDTFTCVFKYAPQGLKTTGGTVQGFELAGEDGKAYPAVAKITASGTVTVTCGKVPVPTVVLFGWHNYPETNLVNSHNLPAGPFRREKL